MKSRFPNSFRTSVEDSLHRDRQVKGQKFTYVLDNKEIRFVVHMPARNNRWICVGENGERFLFDEMNLSRMIFQQNRDC